MLVYLDSKDLINLLDGSTSVRLEEFIAELQAGSHHLVVSCPTIIEIAGPLLSKNARRNVTRLLAQLEKMPLVFLNEARLDPLELREAVDVRLLLRIFAGRHVAIDRVRPWPAQERQPSLQVGHALEYARQR